MIPKITGPHEILYRLDRILGRLCLQGKHCKLLIMRVNVVIKPGSDGREWKFTGIYGNPEVTKRKESWALLRHLSHFQPTPWFCVGDFNEILVSAKKQGAALCPRSQMDASSR